MLCLSHTHVHDLAICYVFDHHEVCLVRQEAAVTGVVRGVLLTRRGAEGGQGGTTLQELVRRLPGDLFRTCLARVSTFICWLAEINWLPESQAPV